MEVLSGILRSKKYLRTLNNSILDCYGYKDILNKYYEPDDYLVFVDQSQYIPLVIKNGVVTFYGGMQHNHKNNIPDNVQLLNFALDYLVKNKYKFQLLSILNDFYNNLGVNNIVYDVPYPPEWLYERVNLFDVDEFIQGFTGKDRWSLKRVLKHKESYECRAISFDELSIKFDEIYSLHIRYFEDRKLESVWHCNKNLLYEILKYFNCNEKLFIRIISNKDKIIGIYILVYNNKEMIFYFGGSLDKGNHYISKAIYFDMLENAKNIATTTNVVNLDGLRGAFGNKKRFNFRPVPMYALVKDDDWVVREDDSLGKELAKEVYQREFGVYQRD